MHVRVTVISSFNVSTVGERGREEERREKERVRGAGGGWNQEAELTRLACCPALCTRQGLCVCVCVCVCMCVCTAHVRTHAHTHTHLHDSHKHTRTCTRARTMYVQPLRLRTDSHRWRSTSPLEPELRRIAISCHIPVEHLDMYKYVYIYII